MIPDAYIRNQLDLIAVLEAAPCFYPELERAMSGFPGVPNERRFDRINKFIPKELGGNRKPYPVYVCGRYFSVSAQSLLRRSESHPLTQSILANKNSLRFPEEWISAIHCFITERMRPGPGLVVSVIPHRPGRAPRMENLLLQLEAYVRLNPSPGSDCISFEPELLGYKDGVSSQSKDKLGALERFANIRDHLYVKKPNAVADGKRVLVIDDVCTTGASLIYAGVYLTKAGSSAVTRLSISMTIGNARYV